MCGKNCENRKIGCHGTCEKYKKFKEYLEKIKKNREKETFVMSVVCKSVDDAKKRVKKLRKDD